jgi:hypothetical protein
MAAREPGQGAGPSPSRCGRSRGKAKEQREIAVVCGRGALLVLGMRGRARSVPVRQRSGVSHGIPRMVAIAADLRSTKSARTGRRLCKQSVAALTMGREGVGQGSVL